MCTSSAALLVLLLLAAACYLLLLCHGSGLLCSGACSHALVHTFTAHQQHRQHAAPDSRCVPALRAVHAHASAARPPCDIIHMHPSLHHPHSLLPPPPLLLTLIAQLHAQQAIFHRCGAEECMQPSQPHIITSIPRAACCDCAPPPPASRMSSCTCSGLVVLPQGSAFPGAVDLTASQQPSAAAGGGRVLAFATAGERGAVRVWRSDTGTCVYTHVGGPGGLPEDLPDSGKTSKAGGATTAKAKSKAPAAAAVPPGCELVELALLPGGRGLLAATGDARLLLLVPEVGPVPAHSHDDCCMTVCPPHCPPTPTPQHELFYI